LGGGGGEGERNPDDSYEEATFLPQTELANMRKHSCLFETWICYCWQLQANDLVVVLSQECRVFSFVKIC